MPNQDDCFQFVSLVVLPRPEVGYRWGYLSIPWHTAFFPPDSLVSRLTKKGLAMRSLPR